MNTHDTDFFSTCEKSGHQYAGRHILADFWDVKNMSDLSFIQETLEEGARRAGATILHSYYHPFGEGMGVSGVTVLSESHISIHTWPERDFAALDIFMCGICDPQITLDYIAEEFKPSKIESNLNQRGIVRVKRALAA